jgi:hypothetical protein
MKHKLQGWGRGIEGMGVLVTQTDRGLGEHVGMGERYREWAGLNEGERHGKDG